MNEPILHAPLWAWVALFVVFAVLLWVTDRLARRDARLNALREADLRNQQQERHDYMRGKFDGIRVAAKWLRENGNAATATAMPLALLDHEPASAPR